MIQLRLAAATVAVAVLGVATRAEAHPHVFVDAKAEIAFDDVGRLAAVRHIWQFDEAFTAFAIQGLDANDDGELSDDELAPLAKVNVESLAEFDFFTFLMVAAKDQAFTPPSEYWLDFHGGRLTLFYTLPLATPVAIAGTATLEVFDPEYFVAFDFVRDGPVTLDGAPEGCTATYRPPGELDAGTAAILSQIPADQRELPSDLRQAASVLANLITIVCPDNEAAAAPAPPADPAPPRARSPFGIATPDSGGGGFGGPLAPFFAWVAIHQQHFYRSLTGALGDLRQDWRGLWLLLGLSFAYGVFHAAGPGHGKAVITSYLIASGETARRGVLVSFVAALVQAASAIVIVAIGAIVLGVSATAMTLATDWIEIVSYGAIAAVGAWLLWAKTFGASHHHYHHDHDHHHHEPGHDDGHDHARGTRTPAVGLRVSLARAWSAILAVGVRPCSGAIIVLVFALSQGLFAVGVAAALIMALGTGLTVAALAALAVSAKGVAVALAGADATVAYRLVRGVEIAGAGTILLLGLSLLGGALSTGLPG